MIQVQWLSEELVQFLIVQGIDGDLWLEMNQKSPQKAIELVSLFSDTVLEKVYSKVQHMSFLSTQIFSIFKIEGSVMQAVVVKNKATNKPFKNIEQLIDLTSASENETFEILNDYKDSKLKILMHCFTGSLEFSKQLLSLDSFFSASGIITFKNSNDLRETFKTVPLDRLLIETDSPFLAPVPKRGKKNEPSFIKYTAEKLSELKKISLQDLVKFTSNNFDKLFFNK